MTNALTRARRKLATLKRRRAGLEYAAMALPGIAIIDEHFRRHRANAVHVCRRMAREIAHDIRWQEREVRKAAITGPHAERLNRKEAAK